jgi:predicted AlkP superfamily phosphohydrolase/phosphomutase
MSIPSSVARRLLVIGLDCAAPELVFEQFAGQLPHLDALRGRGQWGRLESVVPPITVPAWACMTTGCDPGSLGIYGFRNRIGHGYDDWGLADATWVRPPHIWDHVGAAGGRSIVIGVPPSFPPMPLAGLRVGCFLTPSTTGTSAWTHPHELAERLHAIADGYETDVPQFRTDDKGRLLTDLFRQSDKQFAVALELARQEDWRLMMLVNIALDRLHHGFWRDFDPLHRKHVPGGPWADAIPSFYRRLDEQIGRLLELLDERDAVLVVSDHGAKRIDGGIAINEWLIERDYLAIEGGLPDRPTPLSTLRVDWSRTRAWSEGGYYARVFINRRGREPNGTVTPSDYEAFRRRLAVEIAAIPDDAGRPLATRVHTPGELYPVANGYPPDLLVLFGDLHWRSIGSVGHGRVAVLDNDTGPDEANHAQHGIYIAAGPGIDRAANVDRHLLDIAPWILRMLGLPAAIECGQAEAT